MKTLKFKPHLVKPILSGEKTSTWRLFDEKNLQVGDRLELLNSETRIIFAKAKVDSVVIKELGELTDDDWEGHERFPNQQEMYKTFSSYYQKEVTPATEVKMVKFSLVS